MLIIALVLAVIGLAALVTAVVTSNELIAWVCIGASLIGVLLLIIDAVRERSRRDRGDDVVATDTDETEQFDADYPDDPDDSEPHTDIVDREHDPESDTRAVPFDERHEDEPATRSGPQPGAPN
jgi:phosphopantothenoylcysteine synthetase/decarboxylase